MFCKFTRSFHGVVKSFSKRFISSETASALKQLYLAVHPDLFGKFPTQQLINEDSLKKLNSFIDAVSVEGYTEPLNLKFYLRGSPKQECKNADDLHLVNITLHTNSVEQAVSHILHSCGLPCEELPVSRTPPKPKIQWADYDDLFQFESWYKKKRKETTQTFTSTSSPVLTLKHFLTNSAPLARERLVNVQDVRTENMKICEKLRMEMKLEKVILDCGFGCVPIQGFLRNFYSLFNRNRENIPILSGRILMFGGSTTCTNALGHIVLSVEDVPQNWLKLLRSLYDYDVLVAEVPLWEKRLSKRLGNLQIVADHELPCMPITDYLQQLNRLLLRLKSAELKTNTPNCCLVEPGSLTDLKAAVLSSCDSIQLSPSGQFRIPGICFPDILVDFLLKNKQHSLEIAEEFIKNSHEEQVLIQECKEELGLSDLLKDRSVTLVQMITCSRKLLDTFEKEMEDLRITVGHSYHISDDGDISIPWNWK